MLNRQSLAPQQFMQLADRLRQKGVMVNPVLFDPRQGRFNVRGTLETFRVFPSAKSQSGYVICQTSVQNNQEIYTPFAANTADFVQQFARLNKPFSHQANAHFCNVLKNKLSGAGQVISSVNFRDGTFHVKGVNFQLINTPRLGDPNAYKIYNLDTRQVYASKTDEFVQRISREPVPTLSQPFPQQIPGQTRPYVAVASMRPIQQSQYASVPPGVQKPQPKTPNEFQEMLNDLQSQFGRGVSIKHAEPDKAKITIMVGRENKYEIDLEARPTNPSRNNGKSYVMLMTDRSKNETRVVRNMDEMVKTLNKNHPDTRGEMMKKFSPAPEMKASEQAHYQVVPKTRP